MRVAFGLLKLGDGLGEHAGVFQHFVRIVALQVFRHILPVIAELFDLFRFPAHRFRDQAFALRVVFIPVKSFLIGLGAAIRLPQFLFPFEFIERLFLLFSLNVHFNQGAIIRILTTHHGDAFIQFSLFSGRLAGEFVLRIFFLV